MAVMSSTMQSVMAFLNSKPPSSLRNVARKPTSTRCFSGYFRHNWQFIQSSKNKQAKNGERVMSRK